MKKWRIYSINFKRVMTRILNKFLLKLNDFFTLIFENNINYK